jgi:gliding motility-associated protein GldL
MSAKKGGFMNTFYSSIMPKIYGIGASIVLIGVLFKLNYYPGADLFLLIGLGTEAIIFFLSAFEPRSKEYDWSIVYPELEDASKSSPPRHKKEAVDQGSVSRQLDHVLESANIGPELIQSLGSGLKNLSENVSKMSDVSDAVLATNEYSNNLRAASKSITNINQSYEMASHALETFSRAMEDMAEAGRHTEEFRTELNKLNGSIASLNKIYGGMLSAMKG